MTITLSRNVTGISQITSELGSNRNISPLSMFTTLSNTILPSRANTSSIPSVTLPSQVLSGLQLAVDNNNNMQQQQHHNHHNNHTASKFALVPSIGTNGSGFFIMMPTEDVSSLSEQLSDNKFSIPQEEDDEEEERLPKVGQEKRRATHNEVERRRRDRINQHIQQLAKLIPDCSTYVKSQSKTAVLEKTIQYVHELRTANQTLAKQGLAADRILQENDSLKDRIRLLQGENDMLKSLLAKGSLLCEHAESNM
ncbi:unnamed protein product [Didymodactylos carnosus]|uniref:BHLH domain-containing protein n=1 Tax=Didymodactylos carnosus TaxID=1234261 RepID=A0A813UP72_9BILA|nr:unnamed protein product [Didymodactylos carnosus]CAF0863915.1 unnamed protein product [Didymodactylos carnosus]CAF3613005.1 unnamed protein product [Didymodactylos carnosus]CAF3648669.1 unnamed protein product [Didymodactylos carnosus]